MRFRPCIDIHNGIVKQIVGSSLKDENDQASENYVANRDASWFAKRYKQDGLQGGHVILLNPQSSPYYEKTKKQALEALHAYEGTRGAFRRNRCDQVAWRVAGCL